jgi:hypothetical protein
MAVSGQQTSPLIGTSKTRDKEQSNSRKVRRLDSPVTFDDNHDIENGKGNRQIFKVVSKNQLSIENDSPKKQYRVHEKLRILLVGMLVCQAIFSVISMYLNITENKATVILDSWVRKQSFRR